MGLNAGGGYVMCAQRNSVCARGRCVSVSGGGSLECMCMNGEGVGVWVWPHSQVTQPGNKAIAASVRV